MNRIATCALLIFVAALPAADKKDPTPAYSDTLVKQLLADAQANGDARRGAVVFAAPTSACQSCHLVGGRGGNVGPDLTKVATCIPPEAIVEAVYWPNRTVKPEFKALAITTADGKVIQGVVKRETEAGITLVDAAGKQHEIAKGDVEARREIGSLMPDGLTAAMTAEQRRDLVRYLLELGRTPGLEGLSHTPAKFDPPREPLHPEHWPNWKEPVNRDRQYDFYAREAEHFRTVRPTPLLLPEWPGLDSGKYGHWGNQNDEVWKDGRWNETDLGSVQAGIFRHDRLTVPRAVCVRLGDDGELAACFNPETLQVEAIWKGGFLKFSDRRHGFLEGIRPVGEILPMPTTTKPTAPFTYHGYYRDGKRVVFSYRVGDVEILDAPWVKDGKFVREIAPADKHSLAHVTRGGKPQWPTALRTGGSLGAERPYAIDTIAVPFKNPWKALMHFGGHDFFADGSAAVCTMEGDVWRVSGLDESLTDVRWRRIAAGLHHPQGLVVVKDDVYVLGRDQITRLVDLNGDGEADLYECFSNAYATSPAGHDFICGLERDAAGNFYTASGNQGLLKISPDGKKIDVLAVGFRNPDGFGLLPDGKLTVPCSEGEWTPASMVCEVRPDPKRVQHFGYRGPVNGKVPDLPLVYLPRGLDNSSGGQVYIDGDRWGPTKGQMVHLSFGSATHFLLLRDEVDCQPQGAVVPLVGDFRSGVHRGRFNPKDGQLYVTGMQGWGSYSPDDGCFQRVRYTGGPAQLPKRVHAHRNGVLIEWAEPLPRDVGENAANHFVQCWNYRYGPGYGSREFSPSHAGTPGHDPLAITSATVLPDGRSLFLEIPDLQPVNQLHLHVAVATGQTRDIFATLHKLDEPFRDIPGYRDQPKTVAAHPILRDLVLATKREPNPFKPKIDGAREVTLEAGKNLTFAVPRFSAKPGEAIKLAFRNPDVVPHNWVLVKRDSLREVGELSNRLIADPDAVLRHYVPKTDDVLAHTDVAEPGQTSTIFFRAPKEPGRYPFLCTFPGHWMVMNGEMVVEP